MATAGNINLIVKCDQCTFADAHGCGCKHGLMFPVLVFMSGKNCTNFEPKTTEQLEEQIRELERDAAKSD